MPKVSFMLINVTLQMKMMLKMHLNGLKKMLEKFKFLLTMLDLHFPDQLQVLFYLTIFYCKCNYC